MINFILLFIFIISGSVFLSLFDKKFQNTIPVTTCFIVVYLYLFYIFNLLNAGIITLCIFIVFLYGFFIYKFLVSKDKSSILNNIFTPGFLVFTICFILIYFITKDSLIYLWDELRLWGAYPKLLYFDSNIQLGIYSKLLNSMQSYEPGMPLFQVFLSKLLFRFKESDLFFSYCIFVLSLLCPMTNKLTWKKWYFIPIMVVLFLFLPLAFSNSQFDHLTYYKTLFIEPILAISFAYCMFLSFDKNKDLINFICFIISVSCLTLMKDTGILFAFFASLSYFINSYSLKKKNKKVNIKSNLINVIPFVISFVIFISWKLVQQIFKNVNMYSDGAYLKFDIVKRVIKEICKSLIHTNVSTSSISFFNKFLIFPILFILIIILFVFFIRLHDKKSQKEYKVVFFSYLGVSFVYVIGTFILYIVSLHGVYSYERYLSVIFESGFFILFYFIFNEYFDDKIKLKFIGLILFILIFIVPFKLPVNISDGLLNNSSESLIYSDKLSDKLNDYSKNDYALIFSEESSAGFSYVIYQHHVYFDLIDEGYGFDDHFYFLNDKDFLKEINSKQYIYLMILDDRDKISFSDYFNTAVNESTLYKVSKKDGKVLLTNVDDKNDKILLDN